MFFFHFRVLNHYQIKISIIKIKTNIASELLKLLLKTPESIKTTTEHYLLTNL